VGWTAVVGAWAGRRMGNDDDFELQTDALLR
jgi:hypothetical protein